MSSLFKLFSYINTAVKACNWYGKLNGIMPTCSKREDINVWLKFNHFNCGCVIICVCKFGLLNAFIASHNLTDLSSDNGAIYAVECSL